MRALICRSNPIAPDPRVEKTARALIKGGWQVQILGWDRSGSLPTYEEREGYSISRLPIRAQYGSGLGNLPQLIRWQFGLTRWLIRNHAMFDVIHACDFDTILPALLTKWLWKHPVVYDIFDFYADHLRKTPRWIKRIIRKVDLWAIGKADAVILADDSRKAQIAGSNPRRVEIIYNAPEDIANAFQPLNRPGDFRLRIAYIGLLQQERGLFQLLDVLKRHPEWHLDLAGFGGDEERILEMATPLPNVTWHGRVAYQRALELSAKADVLLATYDPSIPNHRFSSPNKIFEAMMLGKPVIVAEKTNMDQIVRKAYCGLVVAYGSIPELEQALQTLADDESLRSQLGKNGRLAYESQYAWEIMQKRLLELYQQLEWDLTSGARAT